MAIHIAIANHKGGVAKSTTALMLSEGLALRGYRILVLDMDPQAMISRLLLSREGVASLYSEQRTMGNLLHAISIGAKPPLARFRSKASDLIELRDTRSTGFVDLIAAHETLVGSIGKIEDTFRKHSAGQRLDVILVQLLEPLLKQHSKNYDVVLFDCPAGTPPLALAALRMSSAVIAPTNLEENAFSALMVFIRTILKDDLKLPDNFRLHVLATLFVASNPEQVRFLDYIKSSSIDVNAFPRPIPHSTAIQRAEAHLGPGTFRSAREKYSNALPEVTALAEIVINRIIQETKR